MISFPGPPEFGRGAVVGPEQDVPVALAAAPVVVIDDDVLTEPAPVADALHLAYQRRTPVVIRLLVDAGELRRPETDTRPPWLLGAGFEFARERLHFLTWANNYDLRSGSPIWWLARKAERLGASSGGADGDIVLPDGRTAWVDGGPRQPLGHTVVHRESIDLGRLHTSPATVKPPDLDLAPDQLRAVEHGGGPARIIAPAGSGKTRTLTSRLAHLRRHHWIEPELLTAVAYNTRARTEMVDRLEGLDARVRTIHSLAYAIVRMRRPSAQVITESDQRRLLSPLITKAPAVNKDITAPYLEALRDVRIGLQPPELVAEARDDVPGFVELFDTYHETLAARDLLDFDQQISAAISLLAADPELRHLVQRSARHLLVDEFQDLTPAFLLLLRLIAAPAYNVFGVGDDDQVIYGYAGATPDFLIDFGRLFPGAEPFELTANYRCPSAVTEAAVRLLSNNQRRIAKSTVAKSGREGGLTIVEHDPSTMAAATADLIAELSSGRALTDIAVLARVNHALLPVQLELTTRGIAHTAPVGEDFLERSAVRALLAYLRIGLAPDLIARDDLMAVINRPARRLSGLGRKVFGKHKRWTLTRLRAAANALDGAENERMHEFADDLERIAAAVHEQPTAEVIALIRHEIGLDRAASLLDSSRSTADRSGHADDLDALQQFAATEPDAARFEIELRDLLSRPGSPNGVTLSTIHKVKGMEWPQVIVYGVSDRTMPHHRAADLEEERRIFHVAITRAVWDATVVADRERRSPFIDELAGTAPAPSTEPASGGIVAAVGQTISWNGHTGRVAELQADGAVVVLGTGYRLTVPWRETVRTGGAQGSLIPPPATDGEPDPAVFEALRSWRRERANQDDVAAYLILSDKHLRGIAAARPGSLEELLHCPGIGPTKLDRYGEEILSTIEAVPVSV